MYSSRTDAHKIALCILLPGRRQSKTLILSTNVDQKSLEVEFWIAICHPTGDKWQSKTLFLAIFDPRSSIVKSVFNCRLPDVILAPPNGVIWQEVQSFRIVQHCIWVYSVCYVKIDLRVRHRLGNYNL